MEEKYKGQDLKYYIENNSKCKFIKSEKIKNNNKNRIKLYLECNCGNKFETTLDSFNDKRRPKRQCNDCGASNGWNKRGVLNEDEAKLLVENNSEFKFVKIDRDNTSRVFLHFKDNNGYMYAIFISSFKKFIKGDKSLFQKIYTNNIYNDYNAKLYVETNSCYEYIGFDYDYRKRFRFHIKDSDGYKYSLIKQTFDSILISKNNLIKYSATNFYVEDNVRWLLKNSCYNFLKLEYDENGKKYYVHVEDEFRCRYKTLISNLEKTIKGEKGLLCTLYKNGEYLYHNAKIIVEKNSNYLLEEITTRKDNVYFTLKDTNGFRYFVDKDRFISTEKYDRNSELVNPYNIYSLSNIKHWIKTNDIKINLVSDKYHNAIKKMKWECENGHIFHMSWNGVKSGHLCPICNQSKGEIKIEKILKEKNIKYSIQYVFDDCVNPKTNRVLKFDFAILNNNELKCIVEYQGEGHYEPIDWAGKGEEWAIENLKNYQYRDNVKRKYCNKNNISLLEIPYWEFDNIEKILQNII